MLDLSEKKRGGDVTFAQDIQCIDPLKTLSNY